MKNVLSVLVCFVFAGSLSVYAGGGGGERKEWKTIFDKHSATGAIVVVDERASFENTWVYNHDRAQKRFSPASTFKIPHTLFALDAGLI